MINRIRRSPSFRVNEANRRIAATALLKTDIEHRLLAIEMLISREKKLVGGKASKRITYLRAIEARRSNLHTTLLNVEREYADALLLLEVVGGEIHLAGTAAE